MIKNIVSTIVILIFCSAGLWSQEEMTLPKAISLGLENNYGIRIDDISIQIADNNDTWARAGRGPIIDLNGSFSNTVVNDNNPASFLQGTYYSGSFGPSLGAQWVVFNGGRTRLLKEQLGRFAGQGRFAKDQNIHNLMRTIHQAYYSVIFQKEQLKVLQDILELSSDRLRYEETKREYGNTNTYNLIQFENAVIADSSNILAQTQQLEIAKRNLYNTLDISGLPNYVFPEKLNVSIEEISEEKLEKILLEENYSIKGLGMLIGLNQLNTRIEESFLKPTISINGSVGYSRNGFKFYADNPQTGEPFEFNQSNRFSGNVSASFTWNLYDGGTRKVNVDNARLQEELAQLSLLEAKANVSNELSILISNYQNQQKMLDMTDKSITVSKRNLEMTEARFKAGLITSLDYRNVQNQYLNAAFSKASAIYNLIITKSEIDWLVGKFSE